MSLVSQYGTFFSQYFDPKVLNWPTEMANDPTILNDREAQVGRYSANWKDMGCLLSRFFERINPKLEGIGDYDADVWVRYVVAGDCTVVGAEFLPSLPGAYGAVNWNDS